MVGSPNPVRYVYGAGRVRDALEQALRSRKLRFDDDQHRRQLRPRAVRRRRDLRRRPLLGLGGAQDRAPGERVRRPRGPPARPLLPPALRHVRPRRPRGAWPSSARRPARRCGRSARLRRRCGCPRHTRRPGGAWWPSPSPPCWRSSRASRSARERRRRRAPSRRRQPATQDTAERPRAAAVGAAEKLSLRRQVGPARGHALQRPRAAGVRPARAEGRARRGRDPVQGQHRVARGAQAARRARCSARAGGSALVATDQEGGEIRNLPWARPVEGQAAAATPERARADARGAARDLRAAGDQRQPRARSATSPRAPAR